MIMARTIRIGGSDVYLRSRQSFVVQLNGGASPDLVF